MPPLSPAYRTCLFQPLLSLAWLPLFWLLPGLFLGLDSRFSSNKAEDATEQRHAKMGTLLIRLDDLLSHAPQTTKLPPSASDASEAA